MLSKIELFNAKNCGKEIAKDLVINVVAVGTFQDTDKDGNAVVVSALKTKDGDIYTSISATVANAMEMLDDILTDEGSVNVKVLESTSNGGRKFYQLAIIG